MHQMKKKKKCFNKRNEHYIPSALCKRKSGTWIFQEVLCNSQVAHLPCNVVVTMVTAAFYRLELYFSSLTSSWSQNVSFSSDSSYFKWTPMGLHQKHEHSVCCNKSNEIQSKILTMRKTMLVFFCFYYVRITQNSTKIRLKYLRSVC